MKEIFEKQLFNQFPWLYQRDQQMMSFGFECGDGWYQLIWDLSEKLYPLIEKSRVKVLDEYKLYPMASQVKEKFGKLRFYMDFSTDKMYDLITEYEDKSSRICEVCGKPGEIDYKQKWLSARCDEHR